jgi:hypothetical protein
MSDGFCSMWSNDGIKGRDPKRGNKNPESSVTGLSWFLSPLDRSFASIGYFKMLHFFWWDWGFNFMLQVPFEPY